MLCDLKPIIFIASPDRHKARDFYENVLGLNHVADDGFAHVFEVNGTMLRVVEANPFSPQPFTVLGWKAPNVPETKAQLESRGIVFEKYPFADTETGIWSIDGDQIAWFKDPFGNLLSISSHRQR